MADVFTREKRSDVMSRIRSTGNKETEIVFARLLRASGLCGWRRHTQLPGKPDFVFSKQRLAIFIDGCFWHACPKHFRMPQSNSNYWIKKIARNKERDRAVTKT